MHGDGSPCAMCRAQCWGVRVRGHTYPSTSERVLRGPCRCAEVPVGTHGFIIACCREAAVEPNRTNSNAVRIDETVRSAEGPSAEPQALSTTKYIVRQSDPEVLFTAFRDERETVRACAIRTMNKWFCSLT